MVNEPKTPIVRWESSLIPRPGRRSGPFDACDWLKESALPGHQPGAR